MNLEILDKVLREVWLPGVVEILNRKLWICTPKEERWLIAQERYTDQAMEALGYVRCL